MRPRLRSVLTLHGTALLAAVREREPAAVANETAESIFRKFADADPSANKSATRWLVLTYIARGFLIEDLGKATETLTLFRRKKGQLPIEKRDLNGYASLADLWKAVKHFAEPDMPLIGREARRAEREAARAESRILMERDDGFTVVAPLTERASRYWGRGTRWCTAAREDNAFLAYHRDGPLVVMVLPNGRKFQLFAPPRETENSDHEQSGQFMDADDSPLDHDAILDLWPHIGVAMEWALGQNGLMLSHLPPDRRDRELCELAVRSNGFALQFVPMEMTDEEMCEAAVRRDGRALGTIPAKFRSYALCLLAVTNCGDALAAVPRPYRDSAMCEAAVKSSGSAIEHVPDPIRNPWKTHVATGRITTDELAEAKSRAAELWKSAMGNHSAAIQMVPPEVMSTDLCISAVRANGWALCSIPLKYLTQELCDTAVAVDPMTIKAVPLEFRTRALCENVLARYGGGLANVPPDLLDRRMCEIALRSDGAVLPSVPEEFMTLELYVAAMLSSTDPVTTRQYTPQGIRKLVEAAVAAGGGLKTEPTIKAQWDMRCLDVLEEMLSSGPGHELIPLAA